jgi:hypothetical protein
MEESETTRSKNLATCAFSGFVDKSLEEFIDCFIENSGQIEVEFNGVKYYLVEQVYRSKNPVCYNFVGIVEKMKKSIEILNQMLEIDIPYRGRIARESSISKKETYRRKDLENLLSIDLEVYHGYNDLVK